MRTYVAMIICVACGALFAVSYHLGRLTANQALSFTAAVWLFSGWGLGGVLHKRLTEADRYHAKREPLPGIAKVMVNGAIVLGVIDLGVLLFQGLSH